MRDFERERGGGKGLGGGGGGGRQHKILSLARRSRRKTKSVIINIYQAGALRLNLTTCTTFTPLLNNKITGISFNKIANGKVILI